MSITDANLVIIIRFDTNLKVTPTVELIIFHSLSIFEAIHYFIESLLKMVKHIILYYCN